MNIERARGAVYGAACGDAMGAPMEFTGGQRSDFPKLLKGPHTKMTGGGTWGVLPGQITDDTHMAVCLAEALADGYDLNKVGRRYADWRKVTFDIGGMTSASLGAFEANHIGYNCGRRPWEGQRSGAGNGSLMRCSPIGAFYADPQMVRRVSMLDSAITHFDPRCQIACATYSAAISEAAYWCDDCRDLPEIKAAMFIRARVAAAEAGADFLRQHPDLHKEGLEATEDILRDLRMATQADPDLYGSDVSITGGKSGFVRTAFRLAFWHLFHTDSFQAAIIDTVNRGGDTDTNGAIVGGLLGALYGNGDLPVEWNTAVCDALQEGTGRFHSSLATTYHPMRFERMLTKIEAKYNQNQKRAERRRLFGR